MTFLNMMFGITVLFIHICYIGENYRLTACMLILASVFLDVIDGKLARYLNAESDMGKQLDSFADFVSFGLAPMAILLTHEAIRQGGWLVYLCLLLYAAAGAFRLSRYNIGDFKNHFMGLPITAAGFILVLLNLLLHFTSILNHRFSVILAMAFVCLLSALMVSTVKVRRIFA